MMKTVPMSEAHAESLQELWNREFGAAFPMRRRLMRQSWFEDVNWLREASWTALDGADDRPSGFVVAKCWQDREEGVDFPADTGWIAALFVDPACRGRGIGGGLLRLAEQGLREQGVKNIALGNDLHRRLFPGIPEPAGETAQWFERRGYLSTGRIVDMFRSYQGDEGRRMPSAEGVTIRLGEQADRDRLIDFLEVHFPGRWVYSTRQYWRNGGTGREFVLMETEGRIVGFCRINDSDSPVLAQNIYWSPLFEDELGGVGPLGVDASCRGRGYGALIVEAAIAVLRGRGILNIVIDATMIAEFYEKLGYRIWKRYAMYAKTLA